MDTALLFRYFRANGWTVASRFQEADLVVVTSCGVDALAERQSMLLVASARARMRPGARLVVTGCLPAVAKEALERRFQARCIMPVEIDKFDEIINASVGIRQLPDPNDLQEAIRFSWSRFTGPARARSRLVSPGAALRRAMVRLHLRKPAASAYPGYYDSPRFDIRIAWGCMGQCSYCAIRSAAGPLRSKPLDQVLSEFRAGLADGYGLFRLIAGDIGAYGQDIGLSIVDLLQAMLDQPGEFRLALIDMNVEWAVRYLQPLRKLLSEKAEQIDLLLVPVQSGNDQVLRRMKRGYSAGEARQALSALHESCPSLRMGTHVMIGFPGETEDNLTDTIELLKTVPFAFVEAYLYSDRPGTEASSLPGKVPQAVKTARLRRLRKEITGVSLPLEV